MKESTMVKTLKILVVSFFTIVVIILVLGHIMPVLSYNYSYEFVSVKEARSSGHIEDAEIIDEIGDTNGPYKEVESIVSGFGKPFYFDLKCRGKNIKWTQPGSSNTWYVVHVFKNKMGNQFAVIRKRIKRN